jgi:Tat protein secretion system quality control protein TatD with DNase activity
LKSLEKKLNDFLAHDKMIAIGETGLDYFYKKVLPKIQKDNFYTLDTFLINI